MIKNERQYRITKAQAAKFEEALERFGTESSKDRKTHPRLIEAQRDAICTAARDALRRIA